MLWKCCGRTPLKKKTIFLSTHLYSNIWFLHVFIIYLNSNTSIIFIKKKNTKLLLPNKKLTTSRKNYSFISWNFYVYLLILLSIPKNLLSKIYTAITNPHPSPLMYIIFLLFNSQIFLHITILIPINNSNVPLGFNFLRYKIALIWTR